MESKLRGTSNKVILVRNESDSVCYSFSVSEYRVEIRYLYCEKCCVAASNFALTPCLATFHVGANRMHGYQQIGEDFCIAFVFYFPINKEEQSMKTIQSIEELLMELDSKYPWSLFRYMDEEWKTNFCYHNLTVPKKNGGERLICAPNERLKRYQRRLLPYFDSALVSSCATAYQKNKPLKANYEKHVGARMVVKLDVENFFGSITFGKVFYRMNCLWNHNKQLSWFLAKLCTLNGSLPQGAPTSPVISNLVFYPIDQKIEAYCNQNQINYTRYSDDLSFSGDFLPGEIIDFVRPLFKSNGFHLNENKTVVAGKGRQKKITGVVVNQKAQADKNYRKEIRKEIYYIGKYGLEGHLRYLKQGITEDELKIQMIQRLQKLLGRIGYVLQIDPDNKEFREYQMLCANLLQRMPILW